MKRKTREEKLAELPVHYFPWEIYWSYMQLKHFVMPNLIDLRRGDYPPEPDEYKTYYNDRGWIHRKASSYEGRSSNKFSPVAGFIKAAEIAAEIDYRIEQIKTYRIQLDTLVPLDGNLVVDAFTENLVLNSELLNEAEMMLNFISGWKRKPISFTAYRNKIKNTPPIQNLNHLDEGSNGGMNVRYTR